MRRLQSKVRGAALITVLVALMIISIMLLEFQYQAMVERKLAYNDLNQLQAYYLAKSGVRIGLLRIALYARAKRDPNIGKQFGNIDISPFLDLIWNLPLPPFPPDPGSIGKMLKEDRDAAQKALKETKISEGQYSTVITNESAKINLNYLQVPQSLQEQRITFDPPAKTLFQYVGMMLINLMENMIQASDDSYAEFGNIKPDEIVFNIMDWVNPGPQSYGGGAKDQFYQAQNPPYLAKRSRFYTTDELKLVKGIDDHLYTKLKPHITVYSYDGKINLNSATADVYRSLYKGFTDDDVKKILEERDNRQGWSSESAFVDYVSTTLNRGDFKNVYNDPNQYPFTVASQSFMIESLGVVTRSKSQIQKVIRVGVALAPGKGGTTINGVNQNDCNANPNYWWDPRFPPAVCKQRPTNFDECLNQGGSWAPSGNQTCCVINNIPPVCPPNAASATPPPPASGTSGTPGQPPAAVTPNAVKILYWSES